MDEEVKIVTSIVGAIVLAMAIFLFAGVAACVISETNQAKLCKEYGYGKYCQQNNSQEEAQNEEN